MPKLTGHDYELLDDFLGAVLDRYKEGQRSRIEAIGDIAHLVAAIDKQPHGDDPRAYMKAVIEGEGC
jgi:hypothetical protein